MNQKAQGLGNNCSCLGSQEPAPGTARVDFAKALRNSRPERGSPGLLSDTISPSLTIWVLVGWREKVTKTDKDRRIHMHVQTHICTCFMHRHPQKTCIHTGACMHTDLWEAPRAYINTYIFRDRDSPRTTERGKEERR